MPLGNDSGRAGEVSIKSGADSGKTGEASFLISALSLTASLDCCANWYRADTASGEVSKKNFQKNNALFSFFFILYM